MDLFDNKLNKIKKKTKKILYGTVIIFILAIASFYWAYYIEENTVDKGVSLHEVIAKGSTKEKDIVSLEVSARPYVFAEYDDKKDSNKYYFLADNDYLYVGYLDYDTYLKLNKSDISENPITIKGVTKKIPNDVIKIAIEVYNEDLDEEFLTQQNYKDYIGEVAIDTVSPIVDNILQYMIGFIFLIVSVILLISYLIKSKKIKKALKSDNWQKVSAELESSSTISYDKFSLYLTQNYIVDGLKGLTIIPYQDIIWIYLHEQRYNGVVSNRNLMVMTKDKKKKQIAGLAGIHKSKDTYLEIIDKIYEKNPSMLVGYNNENIKKIKSYK